MAKRNHYTIIADYLTKSRGGKTPTIIRHDAGLSCDQDEYFRKLLLDAGLVIIENNNGKSIIRPSYKGTEFLRQYGKMERHHPWINSS